MKYLTRGYIKKTISSKNYRLLGALIILLLGILIYSNSLDGNFVLDDVYYIQNNEDILNLDVYKDISYWFSLQHRPVPTYTFALNYSIHGFDTQGYHIVNIIIHLMNALLVFFLTLKLLDIGPNNAPIKRNKILIATIVSLLFVSHPVQTQTVNYIVQRMTLMAALFYLLSVYTYILARQHHFADKWKKAILYYILTFLAFVLAILSKQTAVTIPVVLLVVEIVFIRNKEGRRANGYIYTASGFMTIGFLAILFGGFLPKENIEISRLEYFSSQLGVIFIYLKTLVYPFSLNFDPYIELVKDLSGIREIFFLISHILILGVAIFSIKRKPFIAFGILWFYITLSIESSIIPIRDLIFDHRLYLPSFGFLLLLAFMVFYYIKIHIKIIFLASALVVITFSVYSHNRNKIWKNEYSFWTDVVNQPPVKARPYRFLGIQYMYKEQYSEAIELFDKSIELSPDRWQEHSIKGFAYTALKEYEMAIEQYSQCILLQPSNAEHYINRASLFLKMNKLEEGKSDLDMAKSLLENKNKGLYYMTVGSYYFEMEAYDSAIVNLDKAITWGINNLDMLNNLGLSNLRKGEFEDALKNFSQIIGIDKTYSLAYLNRGEVYFFLQDYTKAIEDFNVFLSFQSTNGRAYYMRGMAYVNKGEIRKAMEDFRLANQLGNPVDEKLTNDLQSYIDRLE